MASPLRPITRGRLSPPGRIPGMLYPLQTKYQGGVILWGEISGGPPLSNPVQNRYHAALSLPTRYYHLGAKHQIGATPFGSNTRDWIRPSNQIPVRRYSLGAPSQEGITTSGRIPGRANFFGPNIRADLLHQVVYSYGAILLRSNTMAVFL